MKILVIGAAGAVGRAVVEAFAGEVVISAGRNSGDLRVDLADEASLEAFFGEVLRRHGRVDAVVSTAGEVAAGSLRELGRTDWQTSFDAKLLGQIRLTQRAIPYLSDGGSVTLTTGITSEEPVRGGIVKTTINRALEGFVFTSALELPRGIRINAVSPGLLETSAPKLGRAFPGIVPVSSRRVGEEYRKSVLGIQTGRVFKAY
ncbi:MAG: short chain dehydrogenase [Bacteriovoracia bacterium]